MPATPSHPPLIGRSDELARIESALAAAEGGRSNTVLLAGEGGVGKTRLAGAAAAAAERRGFVVAEGRAYSVESGVPYAVFADALGPLLRRLDPSALTVITRGGSAELVHIFPGVLSPARGERAEAGESAAEAKARLYWTFLQLLGRLSARQPLLLVLDNLQWADAASLELLHFVARQAHAPGLGGRLLVLGTYNDAEGVPALLRDAEQSLVGLGAARVEWIAPLSAEQTLELVQRTFEVPADVVRAFAAMLHEWTRGNPFFVEETIKSLVESGKLQQRDGRWTGWNVESIALPRSVRDAVLVRVDRVGDRARALLDLAAALGTRIRYATLRAVSGEPEESILESLDELRRARLLVESEEPGGADEYDFSHPLVRDVVYAALGRPRAQRLHAQIAAALEREYAERAPSHADELAYHFSRAGGGAQRKALGYLAESGRRALERHADRAAATYLESALEQIDADGADGGEAVGLRAGVLEGLARARQRLGEHREAESLWLRLKQDAERREDWRTVAMVERRVGLMHAAGGRHDRAIERFDAGIAAATRAEDDALATRIRLARANSLQAIGRRDEARGDVHAALDSAVALGEASLLARVHRAMLLLHLWTGPVADARAHGERAVTLAADSKERLLEWSAHWAMAILGGLTGDATSTAHHVRESERLAGEIGSPVLRLWTDEVAIEYMAGVGEWTTALARAEQAIPAARALGQRTLLARVLVWTGLIHRGLGDVERTREHIEEAWRLVGGDATGDGEGPLDVHAVVPAHTGMSGYLMLLGENARAVEIGERGLAIADRTGDVAWAIYRLLPFVIENSLYLEDYERAARHNARLRRESERLGHALGLAWADATDALLAYLTGNAGDAVPLLRAAAGALEAVPFVFDAARLRRLIGRAMVDAGDREGAERELRRAHEVFVRLGAQREIRGTREQLRALGARPPVMATPAGGAGALSAREAEIARLVAARKSNKEIGAALDISSRTVSTHLSNIFAKLGVSSRGELTDLIRTGGLG